MNILRRPVLTLLTCALVAFSASALTAQTNSDLTHLREEIARNAELLEKAKQLVRETSSVKARLSLEAATNLHHKSISLLAAVSTDTQLREVALLVKKAREVILQTIALARNEARLEESATKAIERARHRLEQARQLINENNFRETIAARKLAEEAHFQLQRSRDNMRQHLYGVALKLAVTSEQFSSRAIAMMRRDFSDAEAVQRAIEKTEQILDRAGEQIERTGEPRLQRMLHEAQELQTKAKRSYGAVRLDVALELTGQARRIAMRVVKASAPKAGRENVGQAIRLTDALLAEAKAIARERDVEGLFKRLDQAEQLQRRSKDQFEKGDRERALALTFRARDILKTSLDSVRTKLRSDEVEATLKETDELLARLREDVAESDDELAIDLLGRAGAKQEKAWQTFRQARLRAALANTRLARQLANRALRQLRHEGI